jgi:hypothetical protein
MKIACLRGSWFFSLILKGQSRKIFMLPLREGKGGNCVFILGRGRERGEWSAERREIRARKWGDSFKVTVA